MTQEWFDVVRFPHGVTMIAEPGHSENVKSYLVEGARDVAVLDTGMGVGDFAGLVATLSDRDPIVLHSHAHFDHIGASAYFQRVLVHRSEADALRAGYSNAKFRPWFDVQHMRGRELPDEFEIESAEILPAEPTGTLTHGERIDLGGRFLEVFHTPGHSPGGITLLDREARVLFPGDAIYAGPMYAFRGDSDPFAYRESLRLIAELADAVDAIYPSHNQSPISPELARAMHRAYEEIFAGMEPNGERDGIEGYDFGDYSFWLSPGWRERSPD